MIWSQHGLLERAYTNEKKIKNIKMEETYETINLGMP